MPSGSPVAEGNARFLVSPPILLDAIGSRTRRSSQILPSPGNIKSQHSIGSKQLCNSQPHSAGIKSRLSYVGSRLFMFTLHAALSGLLSTAERENHMLNCKPIVVRRMRSPRGWIANRSLLSRCIETDWRLCCICVTISWWLDIIII
jgi:hypothetical protein